RRALEGARIKAKAAGLWRGELILKTRRNRQLIADCTLTVILDAAGQPAARLNTFVDLTEKKQLEERSLRAQRLENLGTLVAGIAHDFNNVLAPITMIGPLLRPLLNDPTGFRMLDLVEQSGARGAALVRQMLAFARGTSEGKKLLQVRTLLTDVVDLCQSTFPKSIRFKAQLPDDLWPV